MKITFMSLLAISREMLAVKFSSQPHLNELVNRPRNEIINHQALFVECNMRKSNTTSIVWFHYISHEKK